MAIWPTKPNSGYDRSAFQRLGSGNGGTTWPAELAPARAVPSSHPLGRWDSGTASPRRRPRFRSPTVRLAGVLACAALALSLGVVGAAHSQSEPKSEPNKSEPNKSEPNKSEPKSKIAFIGDSTGDGLWGGASGLLPREACLKSHVELGRFCEEQHGIDPAGKIQLGRTKWGESPRASSRNCSSCRSASTTANRSWISGRSRWRPPRLSCEVQGARHRRAQERGRGQGRLLWVGLPAMREAAADRDAREKNKLFAEAIAEFGDSRSNMWRPGGSTESGRTSSRPFGPDQTGKIIQIRASDGEHFTPAGELFVAAYLLPKMTAIWSRAAPSSAKPAPVEAARSTGSSERAQVVELACFLRGSR